MKHMVFLIPEDVRLGFNLAGIRELVCSPADLAQSVRELMGEEQVSLIVVDERLLARSGAEDLHALGKNWNGLLLVLPAPAAEEVVHEDYAMQLIKKAIGYHVRLEI
ncbi:MAG: hypothetical protein KJ555_13900 [Proteobacteria bacterium]|nr:hypothetical protein [Pseudomonadota bacterium]